MRGDARYARGFTLLLYGLGFLLFAMMSLDAVSALAGRRPFLKFLVPPPGEFSDLWSSLGALLFVVALVRTWGVRGAWLATWVLCLLLFLWFPLGTFTSWSWLRSLSRVERPLTG